MNETYPGNPYPGLRSFQPKDFRVFFGRNKQINALVEMLENGRMLTVSGGSGCGKSSVVRAGLIPALQRGFLDNPCKNWVTMTMRPGDAPFESLAASLLERSYSQKSENSQEFAVVELPNDRCLKPTALAHQLSTSSGELRATLSDSTYIPEATNVLLLVDQFEELFRHLIQDTAGNAGGSFRLRQPRQEVAAQFVDSLLNTVRTLPNFYLVLTIRTDFLQTCDSVLGLPEAVAKSLFICPRLTSDELEMAIDMPARRAGFVTSEAHAEFVRACLNNCTGEADELPKLQHCLRWAASLALARSKDIPDGKPELLLADYHDLGGLRDCLNNHLSEVYLQAGEPPTQAGAPRWPGLDPKFSERMAACRASPTEKQRIIQQLFRAFCQWTPDGRLIRMSIVVRDLQSLTGVPMPEVLAVLNQLRDDAHFVTDSGGPEIEEHDQIDVQHEVLLRTWSVLGTEGEWARDERDKRDCFFSLLYDANQVDDKVTWVGLKWTKASLLLRAGMLNEVWVERRLLERPQSPPIEVKPTIEVIEKLAERSEKRRKNRIGLAAVSLTLVAFIMLGSSLWKITSDKSRFEQSVRGKQIMASARHAPAINGQSLLQSLFGVQLLRSLSHGEVPPDELMELRVIISAIQSSLSPTTEENVSEYVPGIGSPKGDYFIVLDEAHTPVVWKVATLERLTSLKGLPENFTITECGISNDSKWFGVRGIKTGADRDDKEAYQNFKWRIEPGKLVYGLPEWLSSRLHSLPPVSEKSSDLPAFLSTTVPEGKSELSDYCKAVHTYKNKKNEDVLYSFSQMRDQFILEAFSITEAIDLDTIHETSSTGSVKDFRKFRAELEGQLDQKIADPKLLDSIEKKVGVPKSSINRGVWNKFRQDCLFQMGRRYSLEGKRDKAIDVFVKLDQAAWERYKFSLKPEEKSLRAGIKYEQLYGSKLLAEGNAAARKGDRPAALAKYRLAQAQAPTFLDAADFDPLIAFFQFWQSGVKPDAPEAKAIAAMVAGNELAKTGDEPGALAKYAEAIGLSPQAAGLSNDSQTQIAYLLRRKGELENAQAKDEAQKQNEEQSNRPPDKEDTQRAVDYVDKRTKELDEINSRLNEIRSGARGIGQAIDKFIEEWKARIEFRT